MRTCGCANAASASISPVSGLYSSPALYCSSSSSSPRYRKMPKVLDEDNEPFKQKHLRLKKQNQCMYYISLADPSPPPGGPNSFKFMQLLGKFGKIVCWRPLRRLVPPPRGNPQSATAYLSIRNRLQSTINSSHSIACI